MPRRPPRGSCHTNETCSLSKRLPDRTVSLLASHSVSQVSLPWPNSCRLQERHRRYSTEICSIPYILVSLPQNGGFGVTELIGGSVKLSVSSKKNYASMLFTCRHLVTVRNSLTFKSKISRWIKNKNLLQLGHVCQGCA